MAGGDARAAAGGAPPGPLRILIVGLGNPLLRDDGVGARAAGLLAARLAGSPVDVVESPWGGLRFLDLVSGYDRVIVVDAITWRHSAPGTVYRLTPEQAVLAVRATSYHDLSLGAALALGRAVGAPLPEETVFFAVEAQEVECFGETLTPAVEAALPEVVRRVEAQLMRWNVGRGEGEPCTKPPSRSI